MRKFFIALLLFSTPALAEEQYFAKLDANGKVLQVVVVNSQDISDVDGVPQEGLGITYLKSLFGADTNWLQTWQGQPEVQAQTKTVLAGKGTQAALPAQTARLNYAGPGYTYNADLNAFIAPQPFPSWTLDTDSATWVAPVPVPQDGQKYYWDEATVSWKLAQ